MKIDKCRIKNKKRKSLELYYVQKQTYHINLKRMIGPIHFIIILLFVMFVFFSTLFIASCTLFLYSFNLLYFCMCRSKYYQYTLNLTIPINLHDTKSYYNKFIFYFKSFLTLSTFLF